jgi:hypothetical protein
MKDIETLEAKEWNIKLFDFEKEFEKYNKKDTPEVLSTPTCTINGQPTTPSQEIPQEEIHQAKFCVQGTMSELMKLKEFLVSNNYNYQNI